MTHGNYAWATQIRLSSPTPWSHFDGYTTALRGLHVVVLLPKTIGQLLVSFVLSSWGEKWPMAPMITRSKDEDDTIWQDAFTMALRRAKWTHEFNTKMNLRKVLRQFFGMPKILPPLTKLLPEPVKLHRRSYDGLRCPHEWPDGFTIRAEFEHFHYRVSIWCQFRDSVTPA